MEYMGGKEFWHQRFAARSDAPMQPEAILVEDMKKMQTGPHLLDLACGTGTLSIELARLGYDVVGTDGSEQMLSEAMQNKARALYGEDFEREEPSDPSIERLLFLCQPMQQLDMYGTIDAAVCALDSLNHITDPAVVQKVFDRVSLFMNPGAVFVFDVNSVYKHREVLGNNVFVFDREDVFCVWQNTLSEDGFQVQMDLDFFAYNDEDDRYTRTQESFWRPMQATVLSRYSRIPSELFMSHRRFNGKKRKNQWEKS